MSRWSSFVQSFWTSGGCFSGGTEQAEHLGKTPSLAQCPAGRACPSLGSPSVSGWVHKQIVICLLCSLFSVLQPLTQTSYFLLPTLTLTLNLFILLLEVFLLSFCPFPFPAWFSQGDLPSVNSCWPQEPAVVPGRGIPYKPQTGIPQPSNFHSRSFLTLARSRSPNVKIFMQKP